MWYIYKHTFPNGKVYIGLSKQNPQIRFKNGLGYERCSLMWKAIQKYSWESVVTTIIEQDISSLELAKEREQHWIKYYNSYANWPNSNGYNLTIGGDGIQVYDWDFIYNEWKSGKSSKQLTEEYGICKDTITHILDSYDVSIEERVKHLSEVQKLQQRKFDREYIYSLWKAGLSCGEIINKVGCSRDIIFRTLKEKEVSTEERKSHAILQQSKNPKSYNKKKIGQYSLDGELLNTYNSIADANEALGKDRKSSNIVSVCKKRRKSAYGYKWEYLD